MNLVQFLRLLQDTFGNKPSGLRATQPQQQWKLEQTAAFARLSVTASRIDTNLSIPPYHLCFTRDRILRISQGVSGTQAAIKADELSQRPDLPKSADCVTSFCFIIRTCALAITASLIEERLKERAAGPVKGVSFTTLKSSFTVLARSIIEPIRKLGCKLTLERFERGRFPSSGAAWKPSPLSSSEEYHVPAGGKHHSGHHSLTTGQSVSARASICKPEGNKQPCLRPHY